jgi:hypothetical protein
MKRIYANQVKTANAMKNTCINHHCDQSGLKTTVFSVNHSQQKAAVSVCTRFTKQPLLFLRLQVRPC